MEGFKKGPWSKEEDAVLLNWVAAYGPQNWSCIQSKGLLMHTGKSCRLRWVNKLRPGLKKGRKFLPEEAEKVVELQARFGNKWAHIAKFFPGLTDNDVKNFWSMRKKKLARSSLLSAPRSETGPLAPISEISTDDQQQDKAMTSKHQENMTLPCIHQCLEPTSAIPVLTKQTNNPCNTKTAISSAPFDDTMPHQEYQNDTSATPVLTLCTSYPPNTKTEPSSETPVPTSLTCSVFGTECIFPEPDFCLSVPIHASIFR